MRSVFFRPLAVFALIFSCCLAQQIPRESPDIPILTTAGETIHGFQFRGEVVVFIMVMADCRTCLQTVRFLAQLQHQIGPQRFQIVALVLDENPSAAVSYAKRNHFPFPVAHLDKEPGLQIAGLDANAHPVIPLLILVDRVGQVRYQIQGNDPIFNSGESGIRKLVISLLNEPVEGSAQTMNQRSESHADIPAATDVALPPIVPPPSPTDDAPNAPPKNISLGQTQSQVVSVFGQPEKIVRLDTKEIFYYRELGKVTFINGKVADVQ